MTNNGGHGFLQNLNEEKLARGLGYFSLGLGLAEFLTPRLVGRMSGLDNRPGLLRLYGLREIAVGLGILSRPQPAPWVWSRVVGDALDIATLAAAFVVNEGRRSRVCAATAAVAGVAALDVLCAQKLQRNPHVNLTRIHTKRSITVNKSPEELYRFWHNFEQLPLFMNHLKSVKVLDEKRSHWVAKGPGNTNVEWEAEILVDRPNQMISWRSLPGADVDNAGVVKFEPAVGGRGTIIRVELQYDPPAGAFGAAIAKLFGENPEKQIAFDLLRFKQLMETGEVARTEGQPAGRPKSTSRKFDDFVRA